MESEVHTGLQEESEEDTQRGRYLAFLIEDNEFAIEIKYIKEIIGIQHITIVPGVPEYIRRVINLRGKIVAMMDMHKRFKKTEVTYGERTNIIIIEIEDLGVGLIVDQVVDVISIPEEEIIASDTEYIKGIGRVDDKIKLIIDCKKITGNLKDKA